MKLSGHIIKNGTIKEILISSMGKKKYLKASFILSNNEIIFLPVCYISDNEEESITKDLCELFHVNQLKELSNKSVFCLASKDHLLSFTNAETLESFSTVARYRKKENWIQALLEKYPEISGSSFSLEKKINLTFIKEAIENLENKNETTSMFLKDINIILLKEKFEQQLNFNSSQGKKMKL